MYFMLLSNTLFLYNFFGKAALQTTANHLENLIVKVTKSLTQMFKKLANVKKVVKYTNNL